MKVKDEEDEIIERIKKECLCSHCHAGRFSSLRECFCTPNCNTARLLEANEWAARSGLGSPSIVDTLLWCFNLAKRLNLQKKALNYRNLAIRTCEDEGLLHEAKTYSEIFGLTELAEYYQKLIDLKASRPK